MTNYLETFRRARNAAVPIIIIQCPDPSSVVSKIASMSTAPSLRWNINSGILGVNKEGEAQASVINDGAPPAITSANPQEALMLALEKMGEGSILFMDNAHLLLETKEQGNLLTAITSIANCRDPFKASRRTLVLLCPSCRVPVELINDVIVLDVALPDEGELAAITKNIFTASELPEPSEEVLKQAVSATRGLSAFVAENSVAMAMRKSGLDIPILRQRKISAINSVSGLTIIESDASFDNIGGLDQVKKYARMKISGKRKPQMFVLVDEIADQFAGLGDSNGLNRDALYQFLSHMQDHSWSGVLFNGFAGTGKTELGKAMGNESGGMFLTLDMGSMKGGIVGDSEKLIRNAMQTLYAMGGSDVFFIGTANSIEGLPPQLRRRFDGGTFFFDLLTEQQQAPIWGLYQKKFNVSGEKPECVGWTGAEIKNVCKLADEFGVSLIEAAQFISPVVKAMGDNVEKLRESAAGKYLSASEPGYFQTKRSVNTAAVRKMIKEPKPNQN